DGDDRPGRVARDLDEHAQVSLDERRLEEEILGWITGNGQLGECDQMAAERAGPVDRLDDPPHVALEIADRRVDLPEPHPEAPHGPYCTRPPQPGHIRLAATCAPGARAGGCYHRAGAGGGPVAARAGTTRRPR